MIRAGVAAVALLWLGGNSPAAAPVQSPAAASARPDETSPDRPHQITQSGRGAYEASLTPSGDGFTVAWYDTRDGHAEIYSRSLDKRGDTSGPERRLTAGTDRAYEAEIASVGDNLAVAWNEVAANRSSHAMLGLWSRDGRRLWTRALALPKYPDLAVGGGRVALTWFDERGFALTWNEYTAARGAVHEPDDGRSKIAFMSVRSPKHF